jgi:hypothetical protein
MSELVQALVTMSVQELQQAAEEESMIAQRCPIFRLDDDDSIFWGSSCLTI